MSLFNLLAFNAESVLGRVSPPPGVKAFNDQAGGENGIGILIFISNAIKLGTVLAGLYVLYNLIKAGFMIISSDGNAQSADKARNLITMSVVGLIVIVAANTIIAILSFIIFGDATYILNPQICGPSAGLACPT